MHDPEHTPLSALWQQLEEACQRPGAPLRELGLCTWTKHAVQARVVIVRGVDRRAGTLWFHTDRRSAKVAHLRQTRAVGGLLWDAAQRLQLRLQALATPLTRGPLVDARWQDTPAHARQLYAGSDLPGSPWKPSGETTPPAASPRINFCTVDLHLTAIEALWLVPHRQVRIAYVRAADGTWAASRRVP